MGGSSSVRGDQTIYHTDNLCFDGTDRGSPMALDGQLWIGATASNRADNGGHVRLGTLTPGTGISIVNGAGSITISSTVSGGIQTINGDSGSITGTTVTVYANNAANNAGQTVSFVNSGTVSTMNVTDANFNTMIGSGSGNLGQAYSQCVGLGYEAGNDLITGALYNTTVGYQSGSKITNGTYNTFLGWKSGQSLTTGIKNTGIGEESLHSATLTSGSYNTALGSLAGNNFTGADSSNIAIGNTGVGGQSNTIRIGTQGSSDGQQNVCYIAGIVGVTASNPVLTTINSSTGQLGVQALTQYSLLSGGATNALNQIATTATAGQVLQSQGSSAQPAYSTATFPSTAGTTGTILRSNGTNFVNTTATYPTTTTINRILYSSAANVIGEITAVNTAMLVTSSGGVPSLLAVGASKFIAANAAGTLASRGFSIAVQVFSSNGTYTPATGMQYCDVLVCGGGGAGGGAPATGAGETSTAGGGGSGELARGVFSAATIGASQSVTIGAAGTGNSGATGGNGGNSSLGALISANGGNGGASSGVGTSATAAGGAGGSGGTGGSYTVNGTAGFQAISVVAALVSYSGSGANNYFGPGGQGNVGGSAGGVTGTGRGSGGSGALNQASQSARTGGNGTTGYMVITEYIIN